MFFLNDRYCERILEMMFRNVKKWTAEDMIITGVRLPTPPRIKTIEHRFSGLNFQKVQKKLTESGGILLNPQSSNYLRKLVVTKC